VGLRARPDLTEPYQLARSISDAAVRARSMPAFRAVVSVLVSFVVRRFSTNSRPALRAAACGGRPHAGNDTPEPEYHLTHTNRSEEGQSPCSSLSHLSLLVLLGTLRISGSMAGKL
jgi:hypothetical protein